MTLPGLEGMDSYTYDGRRSPLGGIVTVGAKNTAGVPIDRDKFFIKSVSAGDPFKKGDESAPKTALQRKRRAEHPEFSKFHASTSKSVRGVLHGVFVHANIADALLAGRKRHEPPEGAQKAPGNMPWCRCFDGKTALRWKGSANEWTKYPCPGDACPYAEDCKPDVRLVFQLAWPHLANLIKEGALPASTYLPQPLVEYKTGARSTSTNIRGFLEFFFEQAEQLGVQNPVLFGLPFQMTLESKSTEARKFPVVQFTPTMPVQEFLLSQVAYRRQLAAGNIHPAPMVKRIEDRTPDALAADEDDLSGPGGYVPRSGGNEITGEVVDD